MAYPYASSTTSSTVTSATFCHYTDKDSAEKILESGYIRESDPKDGDALFGPGTYLTRKKPDEASRSEVARNNYDGLAARKIKEGKLDAAIAMRLPKAEVKKCSGTDRDVYLFKGNLPLSAAKRVDYYERDQDGVKKYPQA